MTSALQIVGSFTAAVVGWVTLEFVGRPLRKFFDLRGEIIQALIEFANVRARWKEAPDSAGAVAIEQEVERFTQEDMDRLSGAETTFRALAARMRAFAENETMARQVARLLRYDPTKASAALIGVSNSISIYGQQRAFHRKCLAEALRISTSL